MPEDGLEVRLLLLEPLHMLAALRPRRSETKSKNVEFIRRKTPISDPLGLLLQTPKELVIAQQAKKIEKVQAKKVVKSIK